MQGCVLPIGPEFQDPAALPELPPYFGSDHTSPPLETSFVLPASPEMLFEVELHDRNPGDSVTIRWVMNYPPFTTATKAFPPDTMLPPDNGIFRFSRKFPCSEFPMSADRNLVVIASDRGFAAPELAPDKTHPFNYEDDGNLTRTDVMAGWRITITGCTQP